MGLWQRLAQAFGPDDSVALEETERVLLEADFGVLATQDLLEGLRRTPAKQREEYLEQSVRELLTSVPDPGLIARAAEPPTVLLIYGVNGVGKTTTVAKLAHRLSREGRRVLLAAADTFRAGAASQLATWAERLGVPCVGAGSDGRGDPAAVAFDAIDAAIARERDTVLVDTAGRLHTEARLLEELKKVARVGRSAARGRPTNRCWCSTAASARTPGSKRVSFTAQSRSRVSW